MEAFPEFGEFLLSLAIFLSFFNLFVYEQTGSP